MTGAFAAMAISSSPNRTMGGAWRPSLSRVARFRSEPLRVLSGESTRSDSRAFRGCAVTGQTDEGGRPNKESWRGGGWRRGGGANAASDMVPTLPKSPRSRGFDLGRSKWPSVAAFLSLLLEADDSKRRGEVRWALPSPQAGAPRAWSVAHSLSTA